MLTLLSTAIILQLLKKYYSDREDEWKDLVEKTGRWFKNEVSRTEPRIDGVRLEDWAAQFIRTQNSKIFLSPHEIASICFSVIFIAEQVSLSSYGRGFACQCENPAGAR